MDFGGWNKYLEKEYEKDYFKKLKEFIVHEYATKTIYPAKKDIFNCFKLTDFDQVKVVIIGQDPYHQPNQAVGLAFSVPSDVPIPPSLRNIYQELSNDLGVDIKKKNGDLTIWAKQGVLLLNAIMSVERGKPLSHKDKGWEIFTNNILSYLNDTDKPKVFILWGNYARSRKVIITNPKHLIIESPHPSPFSAYYGFFGSKPFSRTNEFLISNGLEPIKW